MGNRGQRVAGLMAGRKLVAGSALAGAAWWNIGTDKPWNPDKLPKAYDVPQIRDYWDERPRHALRRLADIGREGLPFIGGLLSDYMLPAYKVDIGLRAQELRLLLTRLGWPLAVAHWRWLIDGVQPNVHQVRADARN